MSSSCVSQNVFSFRRIVERVGYQSHQGYTEHVRLDIHSKRLGTDLLFSSVANTPQVNYEENHPIPTLPFDEWDLDLVDHRENSAMDYVNRPHTKYPIRDIPREYEEIFAASPTCGVTDYESIGETFLPFYRYVLAVHK